MRINFAVIKAYSTKRGKCKCGKRLTRSKTFEHTVNPFNKNPDGSVKSRLEVYAAVTKEAKDWMPEFICYQCERKVKENADTVR